MDRLEIGTPFKYQYLVLILSLRLPNVWGVREYVNNVKTHGAQTDNTVVVLYRAVTFAIAFIIPFNFSYTRYSVKERSENDCDSESV